jgi:elongation factor P hydroxylase
LDDFREQRRKLPDLGYWYAPDGRTAEQQALFEQVEIKPQAIEWLFATAFGRKFRVSLDNLTGEGGDGALFKDNVFNQVKRFFQVSLNYLVMLHTSFIISACVRVMDEHYNLMNLNVNRLID